MEPVCIWCGETRKEHRDSGPTAKMPCGGLKRGFNSGLPDSHSEHAQQHAEILSEIDKVADEQIRADRWWDTYNAALTGYCMREQSMQLQGPEDIHDAAMYAANLAHGELTK